VKNSETSPDVACLLYVRYWRKEENEMRRGAGALILSLGLLLPMGVITAQDHPKHVWSDSENPAWHQYLKEQHKKDREWAKATKREQTAYWKWRDQHSDVH
jgi:hypothetical protein